MAAMPFLFNGILLFQGNLPGEGIIIKLPPNGLFHDLVIVIITSQTVVSEVVENVGNLFNLIYPFKMVLGSTYLGKI